MWRDPNTLYPYLYDGTGRERTVHLFCLFFFLNPHRSLICCDIAGDKNKPKSLQRHNKYYCHKTWKQFFSLSFSFWGPLFLFSRECHSAARVTERYACRVGFRRPLWPFWPVYSRRLMMVDGRVESVVHNGLVSAKSFWCRPSYSPTAWHWRNFARPSLTMLAEADGWVTNRGDCMLSAGSNP